MKHTEEKVVGEVESKLICDKIDLKSTSTGMERLESRKNDEKRSRLEQN